MQRLPGAALVALLLSVTTLAGCFGGDDSQVDDVPDVLPPAPVDNRTRTVQTTGCVQYSGGVVTTGSGLDAYVPEGFSIVRDNNLGLFVQLTLIVNECAGATEDGRTFAETGSFALLGVPVRVPEEHVDRNYTRNVIPVALIVEDDTFAKRWHEWGIHVTRTGTVDLAATALPNGEVHEITVTGNETSFTSRATLGPIGDTFARNNYRLWAVEDNNATGALLVDNLAGPRIGQGGHAWTAEGGEAIPAQSSGIITAGSGIDAYYRWVTAGTTKAPLNDDGSEAARDPNEPDPSAGRRHAEPIQLL